MSLLEVRNLTKYFGGLAAVNELNFEMNEGEMLALIGPNGAGKSTVFNLITSYYRPSKGTIIFRGKNITNFFKLERGYLSYSVKLIIYLFLFVFQLLFIRQVLPLASTTGPKVNTVWICPYCRILVKFYRKSLEIFFSFFIYPDVNNISRD